MQTLLIAGFGDVARRAVPLLRGHWRLLALTHSARQLQQAHELGITAVGADLDHGPSLARLAGLADAVLYSAPPAQSGQQDARLKRLIAALARAERKPRLLVYISTSGVYGDRGGAWLDECAPPHAQTPRAQRRLAAEGLLRQLARRWPMAITILRAPGIYAAERLPLERIRAAEPVPAAEAHCYTNHIHADDLAAICARALRRYGGVRVYHASDDCPIQVCDWFDALAEHLGMSPPPRLALTDLARASSPLRMSFLSESRRLCNARLKRELYPKLRYPDVQQFLAGLVPASMLATDHQ